MRDKVESELDLYIKKVTAISLFCKLVRMMEKWQTLFIQKLFHIDGKVLWLNQLNIYLIG